MTIIGNSNAIICQLLQFINVVMLGIYPPVKWKGIRLLKMKMSQGGTQGVRTFGKNVSQITFEYILFLKVNLRFWNIQDVRRALAMATHPDIEAMLLEDEEFDLHWAEQGWQ